MRHLITIFLLFISITYCLSYKQVKRSVVRDYSKIWRRGNVIYTMSGAFTQDEQTLIQSVMKEIEDDVKFHEQYCIRFHNKVGEYAFEPDYVFLTKGASCSFPQVGMPHNRGTLTLARECLERKTLLYYFMRILGVYDEHTRSDRDSYISVNYTNVIDAYRPRFDKTPSNVGDAETLPYDFLSVTHYGPYAHAKNPRVPTIISLVPGVAFGDQGGLSSLDAQRLQILYRCHIDTSHVLKMPRWATYKLLNQGYFSDRLKMSLRNYSGGYDKYIIQYDVLLSRLITIFSPVTYLDHLKHQIRLHLTISIELHPVDCDFERALCNLADDWQDDFFWDRKDGPVSNTGPQADHSNGQGYFLYANSTGGSAGMARLISAREIPPGQYCVELYYYLLGSGDSLSVIWDDYLHHANKTLRSVTSNNGPSWSHLKFGTVSQLQWRIIFEADIAKNSEGVAIDDVTVTQGYCI